MEDGDEIIFISKDFHPYPAGRTDEDGAYNGKKFRSSILVDKLKSAIGADKRLFVSLDGLMSCGSSFLESAFGGLIREDNFTKDELNKTLNIVFSKPHLKRYKIAIDKHIDRARSS